MNLIIVCGLARSGTNSVSAYMHLNEKVMMFQGGPPIIELDDVNREWLVKGQPQNLGGPFSTYKLRRIRKKIDTKNENAMKNPEAIPEQFAYVGRRAETSENHAGLDTMLQRFNIKFVYCMRRDFDGLFGSRMAASYTQSITTFVQQLTDSYAAARHLKDRGLDVCCVDASLNKGFAEMDRLVDLAPSPDQLWWQRVNPKTNQRGPDTTVFEFRFKDSFLPPLEEAYDTTWEHLCTN